MQRASAVTRRVVLSAFVAVALTLASCAVRPLWKTLSARPDAEVLRFAVIGDSGTGGRQQYQVARRMARLREQFPFELVLMLGDNLYGRETPKDFERKFERPYKPLLDGGVRFYAALGNHDQINQRSYAPFNMGGDRYYTFTRHDVQFFALDSNYMDPAQLEWLERELAASTAAWRIAFFHHPIYSSGRRHGAEKDLRLLLEPLFQRHGVNVVFAGHEHLYERIKPQQGIAYFTSGGAAKLSRDDLDRQPRSAQELTAVGYDKDRHFMLIQIEGDTLSFQAISRTGRVIDEGVIRRPTRPLLPRIPLLQRDTEATGDQPDAPPARSGRRRRGAPGDVPTGRGSERRDRTAAPPPS